MENPDDEQVREALDVGKTLLELGDVFRASFGFGDAPQLFGI